MRRPILIADDQNDVAWTRVSPSFNPQTLPASPGEPTSSAATPLIATGATGAAASPSGPFSRHTWSTPIALGATVAATVASNVSLVQAVSAQPLRKMLTIQNSSSATPSDTAPTLYVAFGQVAVPGVALAVPPGAAVAYEVNPPQEDIFISWGAYSNSGATAVIQGVIVQSVAVAQASATAS